MLTTSMIETHRHLWQQEGTFSLSPPLFFGSIYLTGPAYLRHPQPNPSIRPSHFKTVCPIVAFSFGSDNKLGHQKIFDGPVVVIIDGQDISERACPSC